MVRDARCANRAVRRKRSRFERVAVICAHVIAHKIHEATVGVEITLCSGRKRAAELAGEISTDAQGLHRNGRDARRKKPARIVPGEAGRKVDEDRKE